MLSAAMHLYLKTWEAQLRKPVEEPFKSEFKRGWINGYRAYFAGRFGIRFEEAPVALGLLEEIALARNRIQHPDSIAMEQPSYSERDLETLRRPFFVDETERGLFADANESEKNWLFPPSVHVTKEKLEAALGEVEKFSTWLEEQISLQRYPS
jgi:hypothetical protein